MKTLLVVMDALEGINPVKDSTLAMLLEARHRGWQVLYTQPHALELRDGRPQALATEIELEYRDGPPVHFRYLPLGPATIRELEPDLVILMRKDPPFDMDYIYATHVLQRAQDLGARVVNHPQALRDANEKLFTAWFPQCCAPTLVSASREHLRAFAAEQGDIILKPLDGMGGASIFRSSAQDPNLNVIIETLTAEGRHLIMAQRYLPEISEGDKRILLVNGEPVPYALARIPSKEDFRGNLAKGGRGRGQPLSERDEWIAREVGPELRRRGVLFAGLDVIGDWLTEINVTSPTCIRELDRQFGLNIAGQLLDAIEQAHAPRS